MKHTRKHVGIGTLENGLEYYRECLRFHLSVDVTPRDVHELGKKEVERIKTQMQKVGMHVYYS